MGINGGVTKATSIDELVFSEDDEVKPDLQARFVGAGWMLRQHAPLAGPGAWVLTVRGLDPAEFTIYRSEKTRSETMAARRAINTCVSRVEYHAGDKRVVLTKRPALSEFFDGLAILGPVGREGLYADMLGEVIEAKSVLRSVESCYADARAQLGYEPVEAEEGDGSAIDSKSGA